MFAKKTRNYDLALQSYTRSALLFFGIAPESKKPQSNPARHGIILRYILFFHQAGRL
jgi:hypothetical protein